MSISSLTLTIILLLSLFFELNVAAFTSHSHRYVFMSNIMTDLKLSPDENQEKVISVKKPPKKKKFTINPDIIGIPSISSDGILKEKIEEREARKRQAPTVKSNLGVPSKKTKPSIDKKDKSLSAKAFKAQNQRTAGGLIDSTQESRLASPPEEQNLQVQVAKRGEKIVTMVRGMSWPMEDRKTLLKELKKKLGGGGTLVDGVLELQGGHSEKVESFLKRKGFTKIKVIG